ncbi:hypothetical protein [Hymenobacter sp. DG25A]|uniref:hypothetical protein n=1 Tax=Hymenobacter sp. DG25A TaxID=1385663 RepID=UPI0006BD2F80|nr:hypothetical protein [Hymenobacter sp. DG25A]ALD21536.1 hypothetical protein AM218_10360 [Hymenobacter sp. DG25A]
MKIVYLYQWMLAVTLTTCLLASCKKGDKTDPTFTEQTFTGRIQLYDQYGDALTDNSGLQVETLDGSFKTTTSADGQFSLTAKKLAHGHRLRMSIYKSSLPEYALYFTDDLPFDKKDVALPEVIQMGITSCASYTCEMVRHPDKGYTVVKGVLKNCAGAPSWPEAKPRYHRYVFSPAFLSHEGYNIQVNKGSLLIKDNLNNGFLDTIYYASLKSKNIDPQLPWAIAIDNIKADSCQMPYIVGAYGLQLANGYDGNARDYKAYPGAISNNGSINYPIQQP